MATNPPMRHPVSTYVDTPYPVPQFHAALYVIDQRRRESRSSDHTLAPFDTGVIHGPTIPHMEATMPDRYTPELIGRTATTRWGEHGRIIGAAQDPARCGFLPDGATIYMTPQLRHLAFDPVEDTSEDPSTDHGYAECPDCGNVGVKIDSTGYVPCTRFLTCWADPSEA